MYIYIYIYMYIYIWLRHGRCDALRDDTWPELLRLVKEESSRRDAVFDMLECVSSSVLKNTTGAKMPPQVGLPAQRRSCAEAAVQRSLDPSQLASSPGRARSVAKSALSALSFRQVSGLKDAELYASTTTPAISRFVRPAGPSSLACGPRRSRQTAISKVRSAGFGLRLVSGRLARSPSKRFRV